MMSDITFKVPKQYEEIVKRWVAALNTGEYVQGRGKLYNALSNSYCCIGVLGGICGVPKGTMDEKGLFNNEWFFGKIPPEVPKFIIGSMDLSERNGDVENPLVHRLATMNDYGYSFSQIADFIENSIEFI